MNKHAKSALIVVYVLQLLVLFRETLGQLYKNTLESVRHEITSHDEMPRPNSGTTAPAERWRDVLLAIVSIANPHNRGIVVLTAATQIAFLEEEHGRGHVHPHHEIHHT